MSGESAGLKIAVLVKQVPAASAVSINRETRGLVVGLERAINTYDAYGLGTAIGLKERFGGTVTAVSAGPPEVRDVLLRALATGADDAILLDFPEHNDIDSLQMARDLAREIAARGFDLVIAGQSTEDIETGQVGPQVAELLGWPHVSMVTHVELVRDELHVNRDSEGTKEKLGVHPPAVLMVHTGRDEEQRHPTLRGMMAAKKKPIEIVTNPGPGEAPTLTWTEPVAVERESTGVIVQGKPAQEAAGDLVAWLREQKLV
jgi:electron transfer flavoprotein alpha/beta subunit